MRRALIASLLLLGAAAPVDAATWTKPAALSTGAGFLPRVSVGRGGDAAVAWTQDGGAWVATRPAGDVFHAPVRLGDGGWPAVAVNSAGAAVVAWTAADGGVQVALRSPGGEFGAPHLVSSQQRSSYRDPLRLAVAINSRGDVAVAWFEPPADWQPGSNTRRTMAAVRPAAGSFSPPQQIAVNDSVSDFPSVVLDDEGRATLAWQDGYSSSGHTWAAGGDVQRGFGPAALVGGDPAAIMSGSALGTTPGGDVTLVSTVGPFMPQGGSLGQGVYVSTKPPGGEFGPYRSIAQASGPPLFGAYAPRLALGFDGAAAVAWAGGAGEAFNVRPAGQDWTAPQKVFTAPTPTEAMDQRDAAVGIDAAGASVFALGAERGDYDRLPLAVVRRLANGKLEGPVRLGAPQTRNLGPSIGFDGIGNGVLAWEGGDSDPGSSSGYDTTEPIKVALYDGRAPSIESFGLARRRHAFRVRLSEPARLSVKISRSGRTVERLRKRLRRGSRFVRIPHRVRNGGSYVATAIARDSANRRSHARRLRFG